MARVNAVGGQSGFGRVVVEPDEPAFHADWEARVYALNIAMPRRGAPGPSTRSTTPGCPATRAGRSGRWSRCRSPGRWPTPGPAALWDAGDGHWVQVELWESYLEAAP